MAREDYDDAKRIKASIDRLKVRAQGGWVGFVKCGRGRYEGRH